MNNELDLSLHRLLQETITEHISPSDRVVAVEEIPIASGLSGAKVRRYKVAREGARDGLKDATVSMVWPGGLMRLE